MPQAKKPAADLGDSIHTPAGKLGVIVQVEPNAFLVKTPGSKFATRVFFDEVKTVYKD